MNYWIKTLGTFATICTKGVLVGIVFGGISYLILLGAGDLYANIVDTKNSRTIPLRNEGVQISPAEIAAPETGKEQQVELIIAELNRTKEDLRQTNIAMQSLADNISGHFISNYRDTITVIGAGIGIVAAVLGGVIAWGYGLLKESVTKKIKRETEEVHRAMVEKSESKLSYLIYKNLSYAFYRYYRVILNQPSHPGFKGGVELASWFAEGTVKYALLAHEGDERDKLVTDAKSHLLYHTACKCLTTNSGIIEKEILDQAVSLNAKFGEGRGDLYSKDTIAWIFILSEDEDLKEEGKKILKSILVNPTITVAYRKELEENYKKRGIDLTLLMST
jgi:hypothetical protein